MKILYRKKLYNKYYSKINKKNIIKNRKILKNIIFGKSNKFIVILGPCSLYSIKETKEFFTKIKKIVKKFKNIFFLARIYLEKPRTIFGWKGLIYDPLLNESNKINLGIIKSLKILKFLNKIKFPVVTEFLNSFIVDYIKKYVTMGTIGARNYESQTHREFLSNLNMPVGIKNGTCGDINGSLNTILSISKKHSFIKLNSEGNLIYKSSKGNKNGFLILRGGKKPNYFKYKINNYLKKIKEMNIKTGLIIDCSHDNSSKKSKNQFKVLKKICSQIKNNNKIVGLMLEVNINRGKQDINKNLKYGVSVTDECISIREFKKCIKYLNNQLNN
ncbi:3-deoxy-7-phosphoheptulonate synthase [Candidatus Vidania fulgoroideorum]